MLFNSIEFAIFLPIVYLLFWFVCNKSLRHQNILIVASSFFFYGWWDWRFLGLLVFTAGIDFFVAQALDKEENLKSRKRLLAISLVGNLGVLGFFKYFNFFAESFSSAFTLFGDHLEVERLNIILPVGISFYTFQALSYTIDVYRRQLKSTNDIVGYFAFISFFPQLVAGPIERATNLLPQFYVPKTFNYMEAKEGLKQILWGLFKKVVIADTCAGFVNDIFSHYDQFSFFMLFIGVAFFYIQVYGDFSGYSDIAIGTAKLFGFKLMRNFNYPLFARDMAELWRRWHISLTTWFRDYVFFPLGGSRGTMLQTCRNIMIIFILSGLWHGAAWTYAIWGLINGLFLLPLIITGNNKNNTGQVAENRKIPTLREFAGMITTFCLYSFSLIFFRSASVKDAFSYMKSMSSLNFDFYANPQKNIELGLQLLLLIVFFIIEWISRKIDYPLKSDKSNPVVRWAIYLLMGVFILANGQNSDMFVYFHF